MKKFFKFGCLGFIALIVLIIIIAVASGGGEDNQETNNESSNQQKASNNNTEQEQPKKEAKAGVLTEEKFNQIKNGMTYDEVKKIIGSEGTVMSETGDVGTDFHTVMYEWETDGLFSNANFTFQGGKLLNKTQIGVNESSDVTVSLDEFNQIKNGMTYDEVVKIVGGEGNMLSESGDEGTDFYTIMYDYRGEGDFGANANFTFQGGKLQNKSQFGLK
ncbi:DUF3862 domain-containing protein [Metabacillus fastidiosus]|uniref:DUF3862 domain-containing protein n=1 Tax=Metabacillus fastidiosus TaxID=1458 RepID=UPI003D2E418B